MSHHVQPAVHRLASCVRAPSATLSHHHGDVHADGAQGFYLGDRRLFSRWVLSVFGRPLEVLSAELTDPATLVTRAIVRDGAEPSPDPRLVLVRTRRQHGAGFTDTIELASWDLVERTVVLRIDAACDLARTDTVKDGGAGERLLAATPLASGLRFAGDGYVVDVLASGAPRVDARDGSLTWALSVDPHGSRTVTVEVIATQPVGDFHPLAPDGAVTSWADAGVTTSDARLDRLVAWGMSELDHLMLADPDAPDDFFTAAGSPWFFTLFGRDSLWAARLMLPFGTDLALSTLRVLARRQGVHHDPATLEEPGRILHELRATSLDTAVVRLPPAYYGSIDATPLWMRVLVEAWRWGAPLDAVEALLPALEAAAGWLLDGADADDDGLCEYRGDASGGLSNQGWKDSGDGVNWQDGALADGPIALCEVQGYAYEAALGAADVLEHFGRAGGTDLRAFAARLHTAFHAAFWLDDERGPYIAIGLDGAKRAITGMASNQGHLLATGLLDQSQERVVADRLLAELATPAGLRTLSPTSRRFNPLSYHNGSVWPHDTAICARAMVLAGLPEHAATLLGGLLRATETFGERLPELYAVLPDDRVEAYPAACRPQAWVAAAAGVLAWALAPVIPDDRGAGVTTLAPARLVEQATVHGVRIGNARYVASATGDAVVVTRA